ncbi:MAG: phosphoribosyltransferase [Aromatoleum sp.]|nr:phosphoribosyltransferase [Aromatoleum sp.]
MKLLRAEDAIRQLTEERLQLVLRSDLWRDFRPAVALVPAGMNRIDKIGAGEEGHSKPASELYAELIQLLINPPPRIVHVARTFEPGGQGRCAAIGYIASEADLTDILIVDDGISSGGTIRSLISQAVRAGAKRILVFALLARTSPEELEQWHITHEVADRSRDGSYDRKLCMT